MNALLSMTGFGRGKNHSESAGWTVEVRSVNHRFLDISVKIPRAYSPFEERIKKIISASHARGRVEVFINQVGEADDTLRLQVNINLATQYRDCLKLMQDKLGLDSGPDLSLMAANRDLIETVHNEQSGEELEEQWSALDRALDGAVQECRSMRMAEGESLKQDIVQRLGGFEEKVEQIKAVVPELIDLRQAALKERLNKLLSEVELDPQRLAQEMAVLTDKVDVTEELVRLASHIGQFRGFLDMDEPVGRRCDFLLQEFLREVNTIASKINNSSIAHLTVEMKNELEKIREQIQNLE